YYDQCCGGSVLVVDCGADVPYMPHNWSATISSLVVGTRCELTVWSRAGKKGKSRRFGAGTVPRLQEVQRGLFGNWNNAIRGYYCKC
ncbi:Syncollin, partial [Nipponia nippon]